MRKLLYAAAMLGVLASPANAITWNFGEHGFGTLPSVQQFDVGGDYFLSARGFGSGNAARALFSKNGGPGEVGLGFDGVVDNEISGANFIQLNLDGLLSRLTNFQFSMDSVDNNEGWAVYGSQDSNPFTFTLLAHSSGLLDNGVHSLAGGYDNYNFFFAPSGFGGPTGNSDVLLHSFSASVQAVPFPVVGAGFPGLVAACLGLVGLARRRRNKSLA
jgi:hypothetical protein